MIGWTFCCHFHTRLTVTWTIRYVQANNTISLWFLECEHVTVKKYWEYDWHSTNMVSVTAGRRYISSWNAEMLWTNNDIIRSQSQLNIQISFYAYITLDMCMCKYVRTEPTRSNYQFCGACEISGKHLQWKMTVAEEMWRSYTNW